ncbi:phage major capsid protein [Clostridium baratii]|uniref:phage major capsid protein n=1 Tax=Clostridium baratii TaxID=1561 RepID=UPI00290120FF|nr:phage major capsid protein [Clostridium baratii]MDU1053351.1 phage major capsid protein [Clostridium baratii]
MPKLQDELQGFVPVEQAKDIMKGIARGSSILRLSTVKPMTSDTKKFPVMTDGPGAYWVGEGERIKTTKAGWIYPEMKAKKIAVIIPVTKEKLKDTTINVFEELKPLIAEAFYKAIDAACLFGTDSPFAKNIFNSAVTAENYIIDGTEKSLDLDVSDVMALIEDAGFDVTGFAANNGIKNRLRKLRDADGNQLFVNGVDTKEFYNEPIEFSRNGSWDKTKAEIIAADWSKSLVGIRDGLEYEILKEATLQGTLDADGKPLSLAEQDMIGIKATMRLGFLPIKDEAFSVLATKGTNPASKLTESH